MATIVNTPAQPSNDASGVGIVVGLLLLLIIGFLFFYFGLPYMARISSNLGTGGNQINVPGKIDVNVHTNPK